ncbi:MAG: hypothetical protein IKU25_03275 [Clostridia bacterium]|nr:hypothetical protein [Clostridia bacterium]
MEKDTDINYLVEIRAFYEFLERNPLSHKAIALWHGLMYLWNQSFWREDFTPAMGSISTRCGMGKNAILSARDELITAGILKVEEQGKRQFTRYTLVPFCADFETLYKQNKIKQNKTKQNNNPPAPRETRREKRAREEEELKKIREAEAYRSIQEAQKLLERWCNDEV